MVRHYCDICGGDVGFRQVRNYDVLQDKFVKSPVMDLKFQDMEINITMKSRLSVGGDPADICKVCLIKVIERGEYA